MKRRVVHIALRVLAWTGVAVAALAVLAVAAVIGATLWLTPERLAEIASDELSEALSADVRTDRVEWTLWSSFPDLCLRTDSVTVRSRAFDSLSAAERRLLPADADTFLVSSGLSVTVGLRNLLNDRISVSGLQADSLSVNMVNFHGIKNFAFHPRKIKRRKMPEISLSKLRVTGPLHYRFLNPGHAYADVLLNSLFLSTERGSNRYKLRLAGTAGLDIRDTRYLDDIPVDISADIDFDAARLRLRTDNFRARLAGVFLGIETEMSFVPHVRFDTGAVQLRGLSYPAILRPLPFLNRYIPSGLRGDLLLDLDAAFDAPYTVGGEELPSLSANFNVPLGRASYTAAGESVRADSIMLWGALTMIKGDIMGAALRGDMSARGIRYADAASGISFRTRTAAVKCRYDSLRGRGRLSVVSGPFSLRDTARSLRLSSLRLDLAAKHAASATPAGGIIGTLTGGWNFSGSLLLGKGRTVYAPGAPPVAIGGADIAVSPDTVTLRRLAVSSCGTQLSLRGKAVGLVGFMTSPGSAPLRVSLTADFDTLQINRLARAHYKPVPLDSAKGLRASDTMPVLLPRNITADLRLRADKAVYTDRTFSRPGARISLRKGVLDVDSIHLGTSFADIRGSLHLDTSDRDSLSLGYSVDVDSLSTEELFAAFPALPEKVPELSALSGHFKARAQASFLFWPTMWVNISSLCGKADIDATSLSVRQTPEIRHYSKWLRLPKGRIAVAPVRIHAEVANTIAEISPFRVDFDRYSLSVTGLANFDGEMYLHAGVFRSPLPLHFGINLQGDWRHPHFSFGGSGWKPRDAQKVEPVEPPLRIMNVSQATRVFLTQFLNAAALYPDRSKH